MGGWVVELGGGVVARMCAAEEEGGWGGIERVGWWVGCDELPHARVPPARCLQHPASLAAADGVLADDRAPPRTAAALSHLQQCLAEERAQREELERHLATLRERLARAAQRAAKAAGAAAGGVDGDDDVGGAAWAGDAVAGREGERDTEGGFWRYAPIHPPTHPVMRRHTYVPQPSLSHACTPPQPTPTPTPPRTHNPPSPSNPSGGSSSAPSTADSSPRAAVDWPDEEASECTGDAGSAGSTPPPRRPEGGGDGREGAGAAGAGSGGGRGRGWGGTTRQLAASWLLPLLSLAVPMAR